MGSSDYDQFMGGIVMVVLGVAAAAGCFGVPFYTVIGSLAVLAALLGAAFVWDALRRL
jgi:hypothetical protein